MSDGVLDQERELFERCLTLSPQEWDVVLNEAAPHDTVLRERVRRMLERHSETAAREGGFLRLDGSDPERIGPYRILQRLGEGGMGIVYAAEQREPMRRRVALKVLRSGHGSREVLARFETERQALALMTHPNIARILDAGTTADHRPYIVMEFVPGEPITRYCAQRDLPLHERLALLRSVCEAVQHAHQKGVIHRDLKPSNILVSEDGGRPLAKIIDFGIAKALTQKLTEQTLETQVGSLLGTPDYMSPEQADLSPLDVDTRADVYALGAVMYQLLTGVPPLELAGSGIGYGEVQRRIQHQEPSPPSQRLGREAGRHIRGELDWITLKALEKDRNRRYATAAEFAADITRYLNGDVPLAGPHTLRYRMAKFARKHAVAVATVGAAFFLITAFALMMSWQVHQTSLERDRANREAALSASVTSFMLDTFKASDPGNADAGQVTARELLDRARQRIDADETLSADVRMRLLTGIGEAYGSLGLHRRAIDTLQQADTLAGAHGSAEEQLRILSQLGLILEFTRETEPARQVLERALALAAANQIHDLTRLFDLRRARAAVESHAGDMAASRDMLKALLGEAREDFGMADTRSLDVGARLVYVHMQLAEFDAAVALTEELLPVAQAALREDHPIISYLRGNLAGVYMDLNRWEEAEAIHRELHERFLQQFGPNAHPTQNAAIGLAISTPDRDEGLRLLAEVERQQRAQYGDDAAQLVLTLQNTAWVHTRIPGHETQARDYYERALALARQYYNDKHTALHTIHYGLAVLEMRAGRPAEALRYLKAALVSRDLQYRAARDPDFERLRDDPRFVALLGDFAIAE